MRGICGSPVAHRTVVAGIAPLVRARPPSWHLYARRRRRRLYPCFGCIALVSHPPRPPVFGLPSPCPPRPYLPPPSSPLLSPRPVPAYSPAVVIVASSSSPSETLALVRALSLPPIPALHAAPLPSWSGRRRSASSVVVATAGVAHEPVVFRCRSFCRNSLTQAPSSSSSPAACSPSSSSRQHHPTAPSPAATAVATTAVCQQQRP